MIQDITLETLDYYAKITCSFCHANVNIGTIKHQLSEGLKWHSITGINSAICGYCSKELELN